MVPNKQEILGENQDLRLPPMEAYIQNDGFLL